VAESAVELLLGLVEGTAGRRVGRRIFPLIATLFLFIVVANWSGLIPGVGTIGGCYAEEHATGGQTSDVVKTALPSLQEKAQSSTFPTPDCPEGTVFRPFLRPANADLNTTLAMALIAVVVVQVSGVAAHGVRGYLKELSTPIFLTPIHIISELSRVISLSFRLFGNIFGGEVLVTVMYVLLGSLFIGFGAFIFLGLELFFGLIQALIFSILTLVYITTAVSGHGGEAHEADAHETPAGSLEALGQEVAGKITGGPGRQ
jgi:F-type H+-transporting ATPase subunit a